MKLIITFVLGYVSAIHHKSVINLKQRDYGSQNVLDAEGDERVREGHVRVVELRAQRLEEAVVLLPQAVHELVDGGLLLGGGREGGRVERHRRPAAPARLPPAKGEGSRLSWH